MHAGVDFILHIAKGANIRRVICNAIHNNGYEIEFHSPEELSDTRSTRLGEVYFPFSRPNYRVNSEGY